jgi:spore maturation protein SpmB
MRQVLNDLFRQIQLGVREAAAICGTLFKFMVPIMLIVRLLAVMEWISPLSALLAPFVHVLGLPSEMALVWMSALLTGIYGGIAALNGVHLAIPLTTAQVTVLSVVMLFAHAFPVELAICRQSGFKVLPMFAIRFGVALVTGVMLNLVLTWGQWLQGPAVSFWKAAEPKGWLSWAMGESVMLGKIFGIVLILVFSLKLFRYFGAVALLETLMRPLLRWLGLGVDTIPVLMVGMLLGISYGGGMIIREAKSGVLSGRDLVLSLVLMSLAHAVIEDTLVLHMAGASIWGVLGVRVGVALLVVGLFAMGLTRFPRSLRWFQKELGQDAK